MRLDQYVAQQNPELSRNQIQKLIKEEEILVNGKPQKKNYLVEESDQVTVNIPEPIESGHEAIEMDLQIIYEDSDLIAINKPAGISVHPRDQKDPTPTIVNGLLAYCPDELSGVGGVLRPGIVHRLDKDTSGILLVAKNDKAHRHLSEQFSNRTIKKYYQTLVVGRIKPTSGQIDAPISRDIVNRKKMSIRNSKDGREALTSYKVTNYLSDKQGSYSFCDIQIHTGRTHQIRVHLQAIGFPVIGDQTYGNAKYNRHFQKKYSLKRQFLHAQKLIFKLPSSDKKIELVAELAPDLHKVISEIN